MIEHNREMQHDQVRGADLAVRSKLNEPCSSKIQADEWAGWLNTKGGGRGAVRYQ